MKPQQLNSMKWQSSLQLHSNCLFAVRGASILQLRMNHRIVSGHLPTSSSAAVRVSVVAPGQLLRPTPATHHPATW